MKKAFAYTLIVCVSLFTFGCSSSTTKAPTEKKTTPTTTMLRPPPLLRFRPPMPPRSSLRVPMQKGKGARAASFPFLLS